jgi:hypothetical protein
MKVYGAYLLLDLLIGILLVGIAFQAMSRFKRKRSREIDAVPPGFERTKEMSIDPTTGVHMVVWYNQETGQRLYVPEKRKD